jgi:integrase
MSAAVPFDATAKAIDSTTYVAVLLAGEGRLRAGELRVLAWTDVNHDQRHLRVERSEWQGHITTTKGNRLRYLPMTRPLTDALRAYRHLRSPLVLRPDGSQMNESTLKEVFFRAERRANLRERGPHTLKHTSLSHLAMRGAAPLARKDLGVHRHLATTMR